jgi:hypothetical protein
MDQITVAVHATVLRTGPGKKNRTVSQHCSPFIRQIEDVPVTLLTLVVFKRSVSYFPVFFMIKGLFSEVRQHILDTVKSLGVEKGEGVLGCRQVAVHTISHEPLAIIDVGGRLPGLISKLDFVAGGAELRRRGTHHGVIGETEQRKGDNETGKDIKGWTQELFHGYKIQKRAGFLPIEPLKPVAARVFFPGAYTREFPLFCKNFPVTAMIA